MKNKKLLGLLAVVPFLLTSCGKEQYSILNVINAQEVDNEATEEVEVSDGILISDGIALTIEDEHRFTWRSTLVYTYDETVLNSKATFDPAKESYTIYYKVFAQYTGTYTRGETYSKVDPVTTLTTHYTTLTLNIDTVELYYQSIGDNAALYEDAAIFEGLKTKYSINNDNVAELKVGTPVIVNYLETITVGCGNDESLELL